MINKRGNPVPHAGPLDRRRCVKFEMYYIVYCTLLPCAAKTFTHSAKTRGVCVHFGSILKLIMTKKQKKFYLMVGRVLLDFRSPTSAFRIQHFYLSQWAALDNVCLTLSLQSISPRIGVSKRMFTYFPRKNLNQQPTYKSLCHFLPSNSTPLIWLCCYFASKTFLLFASVCFGTTGTGAL